MKCSPSTRRCCALTLVAFTFASAPRLALAQDLAAAENLLTRGLELKDAGDVAAACTSIEESLALYPSINTEYHLADCYEREGRTASAWIDFLEVAEKARLDGEPSKEAKARARAEAIASRVSHLTISVAVEVPGIVIERDRIHVGKGQWGTPLPIDPGTYTVVVTAPGKRRWFDSVEIKGEGASEELSIPELEDVPGKSSTVVENEANGLWMDRPIGFEAKSAEEKARPVLVPFKPKGESDLARIREDQRIAGLLVAGVGVVGMGVGGALALVAKSSFDGAGCVGLECDKSGFETRSTSRGTGTLATVLFAVGAVALVGGGVLWLTAPSVPMSSLKAPKVNAGVSLGGVVLGGSF
jgi:hypothetical protein